MATKRFGNVVRTVCASREVTPRPRFPPRAEVRVATGTRRRPEVERDTRGLFYERCFSSCAVALLQCLYEMLNSLSAHRNSAFCCASPCLLRSPTSCSHRHTAGVVTKCPRGAVSTPKAKTYPPYQGREKHRVVLGSFGRFRSETVGQPLPPRLLGGVCLFPAQSGFSTPLGVLNVNTFAT